MLKHSIIYLLIRIVNGFLGLAAVYALTRILSAEQYGVYALGMAGIGLCGSVFFQWIAVAFSRFYAAHADDPDVLLAEVYRIFFRIAIVGVAVTVTYAAWSPIHSVTPLLALSVGIGAIAMGLHSLGLQIANARGLPLNYGLLTASRGAFALAFSVALVLSGFGSTGAVFGVAVACLFSVVLFGARRKSKTQHNSPALRNQLIVYGFPLTLTYFATMVLDVSDRFMIGWWLGASAVAGYAAAYDLTQQIVGAIMNVLFLTAYPRVVAAWEVGGALAASQAMLPLYRAMLLGVPLIAGVFIGCAVDISQLFFGISIRSDASKIMPWVALAISMACIKSYFLDIAFQLEKKTYVQVRISMVMAVLNVVLNVVLMANFGVIGAAIATAIAFSIGMALSWWFGRGLGIYFLCGRDLISMVFTLLIIILVMHAYAGSSYGAIPDMLLRLLCVAVAYVVCVLITDLAKVRSYFVLKLRPALR